MADPIESPVSAAARIRSTAAFLQDGTAIIESRDAAVAAAAREPLENELASTKGILAELHGYVAQMCEHFGDKREEVPCDAWRLRDHVIRAVARIAEIESEKADLRSELERERRVVEAAKRLVNAYERDGNGVSVRSCEDTLIAEVKSYQALASAAPAADRPESARDVALECAGAKANQLPGLTATLDELRFVVALVRECLAEHDAANGTLGYGVRPDSAITARIRGALAALDGKLGDYPDDLAKRAARIASLEAQLASAREAALREALGVIVEAFQGEAHERHPALFRAYCAIANKLVPLATPQQPSRAEPAQEEP